MYEQIAKSRVNFWNFSAMVPLGALVEGENGEQMENFQFNWSFYKWVCVLPRICFEIFSMVSFGKYRWLNFKVRRGDWISIQWLTIHGIVRIYMWVVWKIWQKKSTYSQFFWILFSFLPQNVNLPQIPYEILKIRVSFLIII